MHFNCFGLFKVGDKYLGLGLVYFLFFCMVSFGCLAETFTDGIFTYSIQGKYASLKKVDESASGEINVPGTVVYNGVSYEIITLESNCMSGLQNVSEIIIEENDDKMLWIEDKAIADCESLYKVDLPNMVYDIGASVFSGCNQLREVICRTFLVPGVSGIEFSDLSNITLYVPITVLSEYEATKTSENNAVKSFWGSFGAYMAIKEIDYSLELEQDSYKKYGIKKFLDTDFSGMLEIPAKIKYEDEERTITYIATDCFKGCEKITEMVIKCDESIDYYSIYNYGLRGCTGLRKITLPWNVSLPLSVFSDCPSLKTVVCDTELSKTLISNTNGVALPNVTLYVPEAELSKYKSEDWAASFGQILPIGSPENVVFSYNGMEAEFLHMTLGHTIGFNGCEVEESVDGSYTLSGNTLTVKTVGGFRIEARKLQKEEPTAFADILPTITLGDAVLTLPDAAAGHQIIVRVPQGYKMEAAGCDISSEGTTHTLTITDPSAFVASVAYSGMSSLTETSAERILVEVTGDAVTISGMETGETVLIVDMQGRARRIESDCTQPLAPGLYVVVAPGFTKKVRI